MDFLIDPDEMTAEARLAELASILAAGIWRMQHGSSAPLFTEKPLDCSGTPLPLCVEGLTAREPAPVEVTG